MDHTTRDRQAVDYRKAVYSTYSSVSGLAEPLQSKVRSLSFNLGRHLRKVRQGGRVLDIGSGQGELLAICQQLGLQAEGVDVSPELVDACLSSGLRVTLTDDLANFLASATTKWDAICMIDVLEHFSKAEAFHLLGLVRRAMSSGGILILQVPNMAGPFAALNLYHDVTHECGYTDKSITQLLCASGFLPPSVFAADYPMSGVYILRSLLRRLLYGLFRLVLAVDQPNRSKILTPNLIAVASSQPQP